MKFLVNNKILGGIMFGYILLIFDFFWHMERRTQFFNSRWRAVLDIFRLGRHCRRNPTTRCQSLGGNGMRYGGFLKWGYPNSWLVLWNMNFIFPYIYVYIYNIICWECHHPNWRTPSFFRGVGQPPTRYLLVNVYITMENHHAING